MVKHEKAKIHGRRMGQNYIFETAAQQPQQQPTTTTNNIACEALKIRLNMIDMWMLTTKGKAISTSRIPQNMSITWRLFQ